MKIIKISLIGLLLVIGLLINISHVSADLLEVGQQQSQSDLNLPTGETNTNTKTNEKLDKLSNTSDLSVGQGGAIGARNALVNIAQDVKNVFFYIATIYLFVLVLRLLFSDKTEESSNNLKKGALWVSVGLVITQAAYAFVMVLFDKGVSENLAEEFAERLIEPLIGLLETAASFFFIIVAVYAFYKLVTANGNDEATTAAKRSILYSIMGYIVIKFTTRIVNAIYGKVDCSESSFTDLITSGVSSGRAKCLEPVQLEGFGKIVVDTINWANGFIGIILVVLIIYTGAKILLSGGNEDTLKSSKTSFIFIFVGVLLLIINYLLLTFFLIPETPIG